MSKYILCNDKVCEGDKVADELEKALMKIEKLEKSTGMKSEYLCGRKLLIEIEIVNDNRYFDNRLCKLSNGAIVEICEYDLAKMEVKSE